MPKRALELTAAQIKNKCKRPGRHAVGGVAGLRLVVGVTPGKRSWILRTMIAGRSADRGLGSYSEISLEQARARAREAKAQIEKGEDPRDTKRAIKRTALAASIKRKTFSDAAIACHLQKSKEFKNAKHATQWLTTLQRYAFPTIGSLWVEDIETEHIRVLLEPIWSTKTDTATKVRERIEAVMSWAKASKLYAHENPAKWELLKPLLPKPAKLKKTKHHPAWPWQRMGEFWPILTADSELNARLLQFTILTASRSIESRGARWDEIDTAVKVWTVPGARMKGGLSHRVPLTDDALQLLSLMPRMKDCPYIFSMKWNKKRAAWQLPSENSMAFAIERARAKLKVKLAADQPEATPHGFRSSFKDWARNQPGHEDEVSELALAHVNSDETRAAYARDELLPKRAALSEQWNRFVCTQRKATNVVSIRSTGTQE